VHTVRELQAQVAEKEKMLEEAKKKNKMLEEAQAKDVENTATPPSPLQASAAVVCVVCSVLCVFACVIYV
jgi:hypothetical protein